MSEVEMDKGSTKITSPNKSPPLPTIEDPQETPPPMIEDPEEQLSPGTQFNPFTIESDDRDISVDEDVQSICGDKEEELQFGSAFEKLDEYDRYLDGKNPWHAELRKSLFPSQIICFR
jgi:hypothetical protein